MATVLDLATGSSPSLSLSCNVFHEKLIGIFAMYRNPEGEPRVRLYGRRNVRVVTDTAREVSLARQKELSNQIWLACSNFEHELTRFRMK